MTFEEFIKEWRSEKTTITAFTSGSTGTPKSIELDKEFVKESAMRTNAFLNIGCGSHLHSCVAPDFIGGKMMAVRAELANCQFSFETPSNRPLTGLDKSQKIDLLAVVPSQMIHILEHKDDLPEIGNIIIGGSSINPKLRKSIADSGLNAYESYGMTETASHIALKRIDNEDGYFHPMAGIFVDTDERGCLEIYFPDGKTVVTNDLATMHPDGGFKIEGRYDNVIITGGKKVNPLDVERVIGEMTDNAVLLTSVPDEKWGERIILKIESPYSEKLEKEIMSFLEGRVKSWEKPKEIFFVEKLERTANGKIKR